MVFKKTIFIEVEVEGEDEGQAVQVLMELIESDFTVVPDELKTEDET